MEEGQVGTQVIHVLSALGKLRQGDPEVEVSLHFVGRPPSNGAEPGRQLGLFAEVGALLGEDHGHVTPSLCPLFVAKGAGSLEAEAGGGKATGPETGAAELCFCRGSRRGQPERESLGTRVQCP